MYTVNISLPKSLYQKVSQLIKEEGYASRSEFFRTLIRIYTTLKGERETLLEFTPRPISEIKSQLKKTGKYSKKFINSLISGLEKSSVYVDKTVKRRS